jgi:hypothetical protein
MLQIVRGVGQYEFMREHARVSDDELDLLAASHLKCLRPVGHRAVTFLHRDFHDAKRLLGIAGLARRKVSFSLMRVQARGGAKHVKHREYYFDPKSSGYPEAHRQMPKMFAADAPHAAEIELNLESSRKIATLARRIPDAIAYLRAKKPRLRRQALRRVLARFWFIELCIPSMTEHEYPRRNLLIAL